MSRDEQQQLRISFQQFLGKLSSVETKDIALKEIQSLISKNKSPECLRIILSVLSEYKRPINYSSNEQEVLIIGYISSIYKTDLLDPIDKEPTLVKSAYRLCELLQKYFKDSHQNV